MDMAVGVIIGGAFTAIVNSLVNDMLMPLLSLLTGGFDFSGLCIALGEGENAATINYGSFISAIINFLLIALVIFLIIKAINKVSRKKKEETPAPAPVPVAVPVQEEADDSELIAVIAAAIAASEGTTTDGFVVRSIRKINRKKR